jgi:2Fe-2S ferredoxin
MPQVTCITPSNETITLDADEKKLMQFALENGVEGIDGDGGGICSCATCHIHIESEWIEKTGSASGEAAGLLQFEDKVNERTHLGCHILLTEALNSLVIRVIGR